MSIYHVFASFKKVRFGAAGIMAVILIAGCSSTMSNVKTWEGDTVDASQTAVLESPGEIRVQQVNGRRLGNFLMDDLALDYELLPGENQVVFTYKTIWAKSGVVRNGESKVHVVETEPQAVMINAQPGDTYRFSFEPPANKSDAEAFANNFTADVVDGSGNVVATTSAWDGQPAGTRTAARAPVGSGGEGESVGDASADSVGTLGELKSLWGQASEEERRAFLRWAFE